MGRYKYEIDAEYMEYYNKCVNYVSTSKGPVYIEDWIKLEYEENGYSEISNSLGDSDASGQCDNS